MKTLIVYRSKYGTTERCARLIAEGLADAASDQDEPVLQDLKVKPSADPAGFGMVVIGSPIYGGLIHPDTGRFCRRYRDTLLQRDVALFICCLYTGERAEAQARDSYPAWLTLHAFARRHLGGELRTGDLDPGDRLLIRFLGLEPPNTSRVRTEAIRDLVGLIRDREEKAGSTGR